MKPTEDWEVVNRVETPDLSYDQVKCPSCNTLWNRVDAKVHLDTPPHLEIAAGWGCQDCYGQALAYLETITKPWIDNLVQAMS